MKRKHIIKFVTLITFLILCFDVFGQTSWFKTNQNADLMISGVGFNNSGGPLLYNHPSGIGSDGTHFALCDRFNNRVLIWNYIPTKWDDQPDLVLGQTDMIGNNSGSAMNQLNFPGNVSIGNNGKLVIADTDNDRILIWNTFPTSNGQAADLEIYLPDLTPSGQSTYEWPWGVWTDGVKLVISATHGEAILFWNSFPINNNQTPDYKIKLPDFGTLRNISTDGTTYLFVGDHNSKLTSNGPATYFWNSYPTTENQNYDWYLSEWIKGIKTSDGKLIAGGKYEVDIWNTFPTSDSENPDITLNNNFYSNGDAPDVLSEEGRLYVNNYNWNNVQIYNSLPTQSNQLPDFALSSSSIEYNTLQTINYIQNPILATDGNVLIATSDFDGTLWLWKTINPANGQAPDVKINLRTTGNIVPVANTLFNGKFIVVGGKRMAIWDAIPMNGEAPSKLFVDSIGSIPINNLKAVAYDSSFFYLLDDRTIYLWDKLPATGNEDTVGTIDLPKSSIINIHTDGDYLTAVAYSFNPSVYIFKVNDIKIGNYNPFNEIQRIDTGAVKLPLQLPRGAITFNNSLAIANTGGNAVFLWENINDAGDPNKVIVLGQSYPDSTKPGISQSKLYMPASLASEGGHLWVGEYKFSSRILRFSDGSLTAVKNSRSLPEKFILEQNYPNPFNPSTFIVYQVPALSKVSLKIYNILGMEITTLVDEEKPAGKYKIIFDASSLSSGIYFYRLTTPTFSQTKKMVLLK